MSAPHPATARRSTGRVIRVKTRRYAGLFGYTFVRVWKLGPLTVWRRTLPRAADPGAGQ